MDEAGLAGAASVLVTATDAAAVRGAARDLERRGCAWVPLGGKEGNFGLVNIGSDPALAFVERVTNAVDGVIERAARGADRALVRRLDSPREAAAELFGVPDGRLAALDDATIERLAAGVRVTIADGATAATPTLEVRDYGTGIPPQAMRGSILDLASSNKLDKPYLAGAYGQGGSTTFAFTAGPTVLASSADGSVGSATIVRYSALDPRKNKNGRYEYLVDPNGNVPSFDAGSASFARGTLARHFDYELPRHAGPIDAANGLGGLAASALFDPVLPVTLADSRRRSRGPRSCVFAGAAHRLGRANGAVELAQSLVIPLGRGGRSGGVSVRYWLLAADESSARLRPDDRHAVYVSNFGQTQDVWSRSFVVDDVRLPFLKNALVVQVELDALTAAAKRELLSTTRDRLKRGELFAATYENVRDALREEPALVEANAARRRALLDKQRSAENEKLQRRFAELIETFRPGQFPAAGSGAGAGNRSAPADRGGDTAQTIPLRTLEHPTFVRFASGEADAIALPRGRALRIALESDAPDGYVARHPAARLVVATDPLDSVTFLRATDFRGGRARIVVRADAAIGRRGTLTVRLGAADETVVTASRPFVVVEPPPPEGADRDGRAGVLVPRVIEIAERDWNAYDFTERSVAEVRESSDDFSILVNVDNARLARLVESVAYQQTGLTRMRSAFVVQAAFYAFLLHRAPAVVPPIASGALEDYRRGELDRVAQTIVSSIAAVEKIDAAALHDGDDVDPPT